MKKIRLLAIQKKKNKTVKNWIISIQFFFMKNTNELIQLVKLIITDAIHLQIRWYRNKSNLKSK